MQKFNKGIIHRSANKIIAFSSCSRMAELRFRTGKITVTADGVEPSPRKWPQNDARCRQGDMSQGMGHVIGRDPLPTPGSHSGGEPPQEVPPTSAGCRSPDQVPGGETWVPPSLQSPRGTHVLSPSLVGTSLKYLLTTYTLRREGRGIIVF